MRLDLRDHDMPLKVGIVSDTHGHIDNRVVEYITNCNLLIHAGDICHGRVLNQMRDLCNRVVVVTGNNDKPLVWPEEQHALLGSLPEVAEIVLPGGEIRIEHGHHHGMTKPCLNSLRKSHPQARAIVYGHTHELMWDWQRQPWIINPGAAGRTGTNGGPSCAILHTSQNEWQVELKRF